jgi:hypothetical protein
MPIPSCLATMRCAAALLLSGIACFVPPESAWAGPPAAIENLCAAPSALGVQVIRKFCDGAAVLQLTLNGHVRTIKGGQCDAMGGMKSFNAGLMSIDHAVAGGPSYIGFTLSDGSTASLAIHLDGKKYLFTTKSGAMSDKGGSFDGSGASMGPDHTAVTVHGQFVCAKS